MEEHTRTDISEKEIVKHTIKDSVFTNLFQDKKYLIQLYQALHPEDQVVTESSLTDITIRNVLTDNVYNDLGFMVDNRLMILVEAQSTWTMNIIIRALMYLVQTYHNYFERTKQNLYKSKKVQLPIPEVYVIYTGNRKEKPAEISLVQEFFGGKECCIDIKVKMIYDGKKGDIINQYVIFTKICDEQIALYGRTKKAILEAIHICKNENILKEYLESKQKEVVDIMMVLYDEQEIIRSYIESEIEEATREARQKATLEGILEGKREGILEGKREGILEGKREGILEGKREGILEGKREGILEGKHEGMYNEKIETAKRMLKDGTLPIDKIAEFTSLSIEKIQELINTL